MSSQRLWRNLILLKHISISLHGYGECLNSACKIEILEGYIKGKVKQLVKTSTLFACPVALSGQKNDKKDNNSTSILGFTLIKSLTRFCSWPVAHLSPMQGVLQCYADAM